jgi:hypothetical protein
MKRRLLGISWMMAATCGLAAPLSEQMAATEGLRGVETAKLGPIQIFGITQYRRALSQGEVARLRVATLNLETGDLVGMSDAEKGEFRAQQKAQLTEADADLLVVQELDLTAVDEIKSWLGAAYGYLAAAPTGSEQSHGFFYRKARVEPLKVAILPIPPADHPVVRGKWRLVPEGTTFTAFHVYFPPHDPVKRQKQAEMVAREVVGEEGPLLLLGDFSTWPYRPADKRVLYYDGPSLMEILRKGSLADAQTRGLFGHLGPSGDLILAGRQGTESLEVALSHVMVNPEVEVVLSTLSAPSGKEQGGPRRLLAVDLALPVESSPKD